MSQLTVLTGCKHNFENFMAVSNGMAVKFVHDSENEHSENAVWVVVDGVGVIGHVTEGYIPSGFKAYGDEAVRSSDILNQILRKDIEYEAVIDGKRPNGCLILFKTTSEEVVEEEEEDNMDIEVIGNTEGLHTLVGVQYYVDKVEIGTEVVLEVKNNTTFGIDKNGELLGVFPQKDAKCDEVINLGCPLTRNSEIKNDALSFEKEYIVTGFITETKGNKISKYAVLQLKSVIEATEEDKEELYMKRTITYGFAKMAELQTLYDVENIVEEVVEEIKEAETLCSVEDELVTLNEEIRALKKEEEAIKAKREALMAKREKLAAINAKRIALIEEIQSGLESLDLSTLEAIKGCMSSSTPEEDTSSFDEEETVPKVVQKVHEGKELTLPEWEEYIETYWKRGFNALRKKEGRITDETSDATIKRFVKAIIRFNNKIWSFKDQGYDKIISRYWILNPKILKRVCDLYDLSSYRLNHTCVMKNDDIAFFLKESRM